MHCASLVVMSILKPSLLLGRFASVGINYILICAPICLLPIQHHTFTVLFMLAFQERIDNFSTYVSEDLLIGNEKVKRPDQVIKLVRER